MLKIPDETFKGSQEFESFCLEFKKRSEVMKNSTFTLTTFGNRSCGYFCSETMLNLILRVSTATGIKVLGKVLDFATIQRKTNESKQKSDFNEFCRKMLPKRHELQGFNETPAFLPKLI